MASKVERPAAQLGALGIAADDAGEVLHFDFNEPPGWFGRWWWWWCYAWLR